jgi:hypothetical protein
MEKNLDLYLTLLSESPARRSLFVLKLQYDLTGVFHEYLCLSISRKIDIKDEWSYEIKQLSSEVIKLMEKETTVKFKDKNKAIITAISNINLKQQVTEAKNKIKRYNPKKSRIIERLHIDENEELVNMFNEFLPKYKHILKTL